jgi:isoleucyl-tRNA synthetase
MNVSSVEVTQADGLDGAALLETTAKFASGTKCERCWRYTHDVGEEGEYPTVCLRCAEALEAISFPPYPAPTATEATV